MAETNATPTPITTPAAIPAVGGPTATAVDAAAVVTTVTGAATFDAIRMTNPLWKLQQLRHSIGPLQHLLQ